MIEKIATGAVLWGALQLSVADVATERGKAVLDQAERVAQMEQDARCALAAGYGLDDLRRAGLTIDCEKR